MPWNFMGHTMIFFFYTFSSHDHLWLSGHWCFTVLLPPGSYLSRTRGPEQLDLQLQPRSSYSQTCQAPSYKQPRIQSVLPLGCFTVVSFIFSASGPAWAALHYRTLGILQRAQSPAPQQSPPLSAFRRKRLFCSLEKGKEIKLLGSQEQSHVCVINMSHIVVSPKCFHLAKPKGEALSQRFLLFGTYYQFKSA